MSASVSNEEGCGYVTAFQQLHSKPSALANARFRAFRKPSAEGAEHGQISLEELTSLKLSDDSPRPKSEKRTSDYEERMCKNRQGGLPSAYHSGGFSLPGGRRNFAGSFATVVGFTAGFTLSALSAMSVRKCMPVKLIRFTAS